MSDSIAMFFDAGFEPVNYVDSLFQSISKQQSKQQSHPTYSQANLSKLSNDISTLTTHLDYYTNELSANLKSKLDLLEQNSAQVVSEGGGTRLQYQVNILHNSIVGLETELKEINKETTETEATASTENESTSDAAPSKNSVSKSSPIHTLVQLKLVKSRMAQVLQHLTFLSETIGKQVSGYDGTVSIEKFQFALNQLLESARESKAQKPQDPKFWGVVDTLIDLNPVFNSTQFASSYRDFVKKLTVERSRK